MRRQASATALILTLAAAAATAQADTIPRVASASGQLAVLNGVATVDLQAVAPFPLGIPAPAGRMTIALQSTFEPPGPMVVNVEFWCTAADGNDFFASGTGSDGRTWHVHLAAGDPLWLFGWSTSPSSGPCGAGRATVPLIGPAFITP